MARDQLINFGCSEEGAEKLLTLITDPTLEGRVAAVLCGHTHKIGEFRISRSDENKGFCVYFDDYFKQKDIGHWGRERSPLLLISGSLKWQYKPQFREIHVKGSGLDAGIETIQMQQIERFR